MDDDLQASAPAPRDRSGAPLVPGRPALTLQTFDSPFLRVVKHRNYVSDFADDVIVIRVKSGPVWQEITIADLRRVLMPPCPAYPYVRPVTAHRHLVDLIKAAINRQLGCGTSERSVAVVCHVSMTLAIWAFDHDHFRVASLGRDDFNDFALALCQGRHVVLGIEPRLRLFLDQIVAISDPVRRRAEARSWLSPRLNHTYAIRSDGIFARLGLPFNRKALPVWFATELVEMAGLKKEQLTYQGETFGAIGSKTAQLYLSVCNTLYDAEPGFDQPAVFPYPDASLAFVQSMGATEPQRTGNLPIDTAVRMMATSAVWELDYCPHVLALGRACRRALARMVAEGLRPNDYGTQLRTERMRKVIARTLKQLRKAGTDLVALTGLPIDNSVDVMHLIRFLICACLVIIYSNTCRRKQEIFSAVYGLTYGCLSQSELGEYAMRVYIEKTLQDYATMPVNRLVGRAIATLREIQELLLPLGARRVPEDTSLFLCRLAFAPDAFSQPAARLDYAYCMDNWVAYVLAGESIDLLTHQWRRFYAVLFYWRYDHPLITALNKQMWHTDMDGTFIYVTDTPMVEYADSIDQSVKRSLHVFEGKSRVVHEARDKALDKEMRTAEEEYLLARLVAFLLGEDALSGGFAATLFAWLKRHIETLQEKAVPVTRAALKPLARQILDSGHHLWPMLHGICGACEEGEYDPRQAHCAKDGKIDRSKASCTVCGGCPNHLTHNSSMAFLNGEIRRHEAVLADFRRAETEHERARGQLDRLREIRVYHQAEFARLNRLTAELAAGIDAEALGDDEA